MKLTKFFAMFWNKRYVLDDGICMFAYFHKDSVPSCNKKKRLKKIVIKKTVIIEKITIIEKDCDNWQVLWLKKFLLVKR